MLDQLKKQVLEANQALMKNGLVSLTWGNVSGIERQKGIIIIKPSGIPFEALELSHLVAVDLDGKVVEGELRPSSDTPTHLKLYQAFPEIGGIAHSHSEYATIFAQACEAIPCLGTTHADHFFGSVPVTRFPTAKEVRDGYEENTGKIIVETIGSNPPMDIPGILVAGHGPFTWGIEASDSVDTALILEKIAKMALGSFSIQPNLNPLPDYICQKHFQRKHGSDAYYGQK
jgi:L-ribulose-5-phosphate 4-epimerase